MAADDNLSVTLFRGMNVHPKQISPKYLGLHWSTDPELAESYARSYPPGHEDEHEYTTPHHSVILSTTVPKSAIVKRGSKEHKELAEKHDIRSYREERETTIRPGTPIEAEVRHLTWRPKTGERTTKRQRKIKGQA